MLEKLGYSVTVCKDGIDAIEYYEKNYNEVDLIILDLIMPLLGGKQTFNELKKINPSLKVILSSGYSIDGEVQELMDNGVQGFIQKPYIKSDISNIVYEVIHS